MIFTAKPHKKGAPQELDSNHKSKDVQDLASLPGAAIIPAVDNLPFNNPDGAAAPVVPVPDFRAGNPQGALRGKNMSGKGQVSPYAKTTAPK